MKIFRTRHKHVNFWLDVALILAVLVAICYVFAWPVRVAGNSMAPALNAADQVVASRFLALFGALEVGDIVLAQVENNGATEIIIKRIAAIPNTRFVIDGMEFSLGYDEFFLLGDAAAISTDSRHFGPVTNRHILAKIIMRYFPLSYIEFF